MPWDAAHAAVALLAAVALAALVVALGYWAFVIAEGAYLGHRVVTWFYNRDARRYDAIKGFFPDDEEREIVGPLLEAGVGQRRLRLLDVATGTARLPMALLSAPEFTGEIVGLDASPGMLSQAWTKVGGWSPRVQLVRALATPLPFVDASFGAVTSLEALEFTGAPRETLREMVRVLAPGGTFLVTNRVGWEALLLPGRAFRRGDFEDILRDFGLENVETRRWQSYYDLVWATKPASGGGAGLASITPWTAALRCPRCGQTIATAGATLRCRAGHVFVWRGGAWDLAAEGPGGGPIS